MFCYQCQETAKNTGCTKQGVCGKDATLAKELDNLVFECQELSTLNHHLRSHNQDDLQTSRLITDALFTTITNTNFDVESVKTKIQYLRDKKHELKTRAHENHISLHNLKLTFLPPILGQSSILVEQDQDLRSLKQLIIYGLKGVSAYARHAQRLGYEDNTLYSNLEEALSLTRQKETTKDQLISCVKGVGELGIRAMHLLDKANTITFGHPQNTKVATTVGNRPGILVTGHDLQDLKELLDQTHDKQIDVYTHGEMLPAHYYPYFKKYPHFKGNYGGSWWQQTKEFEKFNGPILFTSNCIVPPLTNEKGYSSNTLIAYVNDLRQFEKVIKESCGVENETEVTSAMLRIWLVALKDKEVSNPILGGRVAGMQLYSTNLTDRKSVVKGRGVG
jgi:hydroxylamine reductase